MASAVETAKTETKKAAQKVGFDPVKKLHDWGVRSNHAYIAGLGAIGLTGAVWLISRINPTDPKAQSDRNGLFISAWVPSLLALGIALKHEE